MDDGTEILKATPKDRERTWATRVFEACGGRCSNCGSTDHLMVRMIVPKESGGREVVSNGTLLCRTCELARVISIRRPQLVSGAHSRPINFFVSRELHRKLQDGLASDYGFRSVSALLRFLMTRFVSDPDQFDDIDMYQDGGSDVKVNVWVGRDMYDSFKTITDRDGRTVTDTLKGLIRMYEAEAKRIVGRTKA